MCKLVQKLVKIKQNKEHSSYMYKGKKKVQLLVLLKRGKEL